MCKLKDLSLFITHKPKNAQSQAGDLGCKFLLFRPLQSLISSCPCVVNGVSPLAKGRKIVVAFLCVVYLFIVGLPSLTSWLHLWRGTPLLSSALVEGG